MSPKTRQPRPDPAAALAQDLLARWGPVMGSEAIAQALDFPSLSAFQRSVRRGWVALPLFSMEGRRGRFALTRDVAAWLAKQAAGAEPGLDPSVRTPPAP